MDRRDTTFLSASLAQNYQLTMQQAIAFTCPCLDTRKKCISGGGMGGARGGYANLGEVDRGADGRLPRPRVSGGGGRVLGESGERTERPVAGKRRGRSRVGAREGVR